MLKFFLFILLSSSVLSNTITYQFGTIKFEKSDNSTIKITVKGKLNSWVGIGFSHTMTNTDMHVLEFYDKGKYNLYDAFSETFSQPKKDIDIGGRDDLMNKTYVYTDSGPEVSYTRLFNTNDPKDNKISIDKNDFSIAFGENNITYHGPFLVLSTFDVNNDDSDDNNTQSGSYFWHLHGISLIIVWSGFNFFGYCAGRFLKHYPWWIYIHFVGSSLTTYYSLGILIASIIIIKTPIDSLGSLPIYQQLHLIYGLIIFGLLWIQVIFAYIPLFGIYKKEKVNSNLVHKLKIGHKIIGIFLTFTIYISLITGFMILYNNLYGIPAALCGLFLSLIIIFEIFHYLENKSKYEKLFALNPITLPQMRVSDLENEKKNKKFVIYENLICDLGSYIESHPGGKNLLSDNLFTDIGRYMTGNQAYSSNFHNYSHKYKTFVYLIEKLAYAELKLEDNIVMNHKMVSHFINNSFSIENKREIASNTYEYRFKTNELIFSRFLKGHQWIGKHFSITSKKLNKTRYYTLCLVLDEKLQNKHNELMDYIKEGKEVSEINFNTTNYLNIYCKRYPFVDALSNELFLGNNEFIIRGPMGIGLAIENILKGTHVIFSAGTGIFPFLDLIALTIRYVCFKAGGKKIFFEENFDNIANDYKLMLYSSFSDEKSSVFSNECQKLKEINDKFNLDIFSCQMRFSDRDKKRWDTQFLQEKLGIIKSKIEKIYIVGPISFMDQLKISFKDSNLNLDEKIIYV